MSALGDVSGSSRELVFAHFLSVPTNAAALWEVIETPNIPVAIAQELLSTSPLDYCWFLLLSPWNSKHHQLKPLKDVAVAPFISVGLPKAWSLFPVCLCEKFSEVW